MVRYAALASLFLAGPVAAQVVTIRTIPLPRWQQFDQLPSTSQAMGGLRVAIDDSLLDPFVNPAKGGRSSAGQFFLAPGVYRTNTNPEVGVSLPVGGLFRVGPWFGGAMFSWQDVSVTDPVRFGCPDCLSLGFDPSIPTPNQSNRAGHLLLGRRLSGAGLSFGASVSWHDLGWMQGLHQLYASGARIDHRGSSTGVRVGAVKDLAKGRSLAALVIRERYSAAHGVLFFDARWDSVARVTRVNPRREDNRDESNLWGVHLQYTWPLRATGWRAGLIATGNLASHPKLPDYVVENTQVIPRDPGDSEAFNAGFGLWKTGLRTSYGMEAVIEPIWSNTWADAASPTPTTSGAVIAAGAKTIENWFRFQNLSVRGGFGHRIPVGGGPETVTFRGGLQLYRVDYKLRQLDYVNGNGRTLNQGWTEITPTWGVTVELGGVSIGYRGSATATSLGDLISLGGGDDVTVVDPPAPVLVAPRSQVSFGGARATIHRLSIVVPIR